MFWADTILLFAGLFIIALALMLSQRLGNKPVEFGFDKLGLDLKADRLTFVLVVGLMMIGVGVFFRYRNYEAELKKFQMQVQGFEPVQQEYNRNLEALRGELQNFKVYDLSLEIDFPQIRGEDIKKHFAIEVYTKRQNDKAFELRSFKPSTDFDKTYVNLNNLYRGERVRIVAKDNRNNTEWLSNEILIPEAQIQMKKKSAEGPVSQ